MTPLISPEATITESEIDSRVTVERRARVINSVVRGPAIIGEDTLIENSYVGPFTSIYHHVTVQNCEIERSIVLEHSTICDVNRRLEDSLIGRHAKLQPSRKKPIALKLNLGDHSTVWLG
jgi:glucose-1-phosphate thymidylyltransferase